MSRPRKYATNAEKQAAYRERHHLNSPKTRQCVMCNTEFTFLSGNHVKYCSPACRQKAYRLRKFYQKFQHNVTCSVTGDRMSEQFKLQELHALTGQM